MRLFFSGRVILVDTEFSETREERRGFHVEECGRSVLAEYLAVALDHGADEIAAYVILHFIGGEDAFRVHDGRRNGQSVGRHAGRRSGGGSRCRFVSGARNPEEIHGDRIAAGEDDGPLDDVLELADIAGPGVGHEFVHLAGLHPEGAAVEHGRVFPEEVLYP